tara:strand:- start:143 stop:1096 length:954 start_codon:yes stop_codon:yes gene_type:complete
LGIINLKSDSNRQYGFENMDDCCIYSLNDGKEIIQSLDFFTPIVDNPYDFGRIAAANSLSDIYAMGGIPLFALNILAFPSDELPIEVMSEILRGGLETCNSAGISILGGHSIKDKEPKYGLVVTGESGKKGFIKNSGAKSGDHLILTKPIGTGIITTAIKKNIATQLQLNEVTKIMSELNKRASEIMVDFGVNACTDVTGYGLVGHLNELCNSSDVSSNIYFDKIKFLSGTYELARAGVIPGGSKRNLTYYEKFIQFDRNLSSFEKVMVADAQTSGGLLVSCSKETYSDLLKALSKEMDAFEIGEIVNKNKMNIYIK